MDLIPTKKKEKLPKGFSYPLGAKLISSELEGVPQYHRFELWFWWRDVYWASKYQAKLKAGGIIKVIEVNYTSYFDEWRVTLHAVPREHSETVRDQIAEDIFSQVRAKLQALPNEIDYFVWEVKFHLGNKKIIVSH